jgi:hypothetical protein
MNPNTISRQVLPTSVQLQLVAVLFHTFHHQRFCSTSNSSSNHSTCRHHHMMLLPYHSPFPVFFLAFHVVMENSKKIFFVITLDL